MNQTAGPGGARARPADAAIPQRAEEIVEGWWGDHFPGSPVAQVTAAWNHAFAAKEELKRRLADLAQGGL